MDKTHFLNFCQKQWFWLLLALLVVSKLPLLLTQSIPFNFDHGKDSLAVMHMILTHTPKFIGPWTSIPGLYFGSAWYYFLAPWYLIGGFNPIWGVVGMLLLHIALIWICRKEFGGVAAVIFATAPTWLTITSSAWNPFPMPLMSLLILLGFKKLRDTRDLGSNSWKWWLLIGLAAGFGFHFSTAYAIFYPLIILLSGLFYAIKVSWRDIACLILGLVIPFVPQALFELKHNFIETRAVVTYLQGGEQQSTDAIKLSEVVSKTMAELSLGVFPDVWSPQLTLTTIISFSSKALFFFALIWLAFKYKHLQKWWFELTVWVGIPLIGYTFLHYNIWYVLGMLPIVVLFVADTVKRLPKALLGLYVLFLVLTPISQVVRFWKLDQPILQASRQLLPIKLAAIDHIRQIAGDRPFAVYHYVPDIYDFTYQYLYFYQAWHGYKLPTEFSYQPNTPTYMAEKVDLLQVFANKQDQRPPELLFYVVESASNQDFLRTWWDAQSYGQIVAETVLSPELTVYQATPK